MKKKFVVICLSFILCSVLVGCDMGGHGKNYATDLYDSQQQLNKLQEQDKARQEKINGANTESNTR